MEHELTIECLSCSHLHFSRDLDLAMDHTNMPFIRFRELGGIAPPCCDTPRLSISLCKLFQRPTIGAIKCQ